MECFVQDDHKKWVEYIRQIQFAVNSSKNETTGVTPAFLIIGRATVLRRAHIQIQQVKNVTKSDERCKIFPIFPVF